MFGGEGPHVWLTTVSARFAARLSLPLSQVGSSRRQLTMQSFRALTPALEFPARSHCPPTAGRPIPRPMQQCCAAKFS